MCAHIGVRARERASEVNSGSADMGVLHTAINLWYFIEYLSSRFYLSLHLGIFQCSFLSC